MNPEDILVVEDNRSWRDLLRVLLGPEYAVEDVVNVEEAESMMKNRHFGLVITNLQLGPFAGIVDQMGLLVLEKLQEYAPGTPCIILTGSDKEKQGQVQYYCDIKYDAKVWVMGKGAENLYTELRSRVKAILER